MLVLTRKPNQQLTIGKDIVITVVKVRGNTIRLGIDAPKDVRVIRSELELRIDNGLTADLEVAQEAVEADCALDSRSLLNATILAADASDVVVDDSVSSTAASSSSACDTTNGRVSSSDNHAQASTASAPGKSGLSARAATAHGSMKPASNLAAPLRAFKSTRMQSNPHSISAARNLGGLADVPSQFARTTRNSIVKQQRYVAFLAARMVMAF